MVSKNLVLSIFFFLRSGNDNRKWNLEMEMEMATRNWKYGNGDHLFIRMQKRNDEYLLEVNGCGKVETVKTSLPEKYDFSRSRTSENILS